MSPLKTYTHISSEKGLSSITTLILGTKQAILIDPPFLLPDALSVVKFIKSTTDLPLVAVFVTHHHPDHYFSANPILEAWPSARFLAAPYVLAGIEREYDEKVRYWPEIFGKENFSERPPAKPTAFGFSFFVLEGDEGSPVVLLGPCQGDSVDHCLFWLPRERVVVTGDAVYARSTHAWVEEIETPQILAAWQTTLTLIENLNAEKIIPGHIEQGWDFDAKADMAHMRKYLDLVAQKIVPTLDGQPQKKPPVNELFETFKNAFPQADKNLDFFLGHMSNRFGEGGKAWEENRMHDIGSRTREQLEGYLFRL